MLNQENIGKFIASERKKAGLTQEQYAEKLGVSNRSVSRWENGKTIPDLSLFPQICEIFGITIAELLNGSRLVKTDTKKNVCLLIDFFEEENRKNLRNVSQCYIFSVICLSLSMLHMAYDIFKFAKYPEQFMAFMISFGVLAGLLGVYYSSKRIKYTEKEISAFLRDDTGRNFSTAGEMLQFAKRNQKIDFRQYEKAFCAIEEKLESGEEIIFSMVAENLTINEEWRDGWKPWHVALAVSAKRILVSGESIRGRFMTSYEVESFELKDYLVAEVGERKILLKFKGFFIKFSGNDLLKAGEQLKTVLDEKL